MIILEEHLGNSGTIIEKYHSLDTVMYKKGVSDANYYYEYGNFIFPSSGNFMFHWGKTDRKKEYLAYRYTELDIDYPFKELAKNQDYRAGYRDELTRKRTIFRVATLAGISFIALSFIFISSSM